MSLAYRVYLGGSSDDVPLGLSVDTTGRVLVSGYTKSSSTDAPSISHRQALSGYA